jgi:hypothetical protein
MIRCTLEWGRLAPVPVSAKGFTIGAEGGMFTRSFRASFTAPREDVIRWLRESPGTREAAPVKVRPGVQRFLISPGAGAGHAEVIVDETGGVVGIYVSWS